jgi:two-component system, NtrC family, nitrogen regulation sensor histidine kinase NtrY
MCDEFQMASGDKKHRAKPRPAAVEADLPLDPREKRKRRRELIAIGSLAALFVGLTFAEFQLSKLSSTLPFVNSIFFFGLLNINIIILIALVWLVFRNIGKVFIERRSKVLGARLKTKLVIAFLAFSIIPTLVLFIISAMYINSSFDKWFSLKVQNTMQASLEITRTYYRNTDQTAMHFASHLAERIGRRLTELEQFPRESPLWIGQYLEEQRELLALDAVEFYAEPLDERVVAERPASDDMSHYPRLSADTLDKAFAGEQVSLIQHIRTGDLIRCIVPVHVDASKARPIAGVLVVSSYIPVSLVNKVDEIASVIDDYKDTNPLKYPMKTTYLLILIMITLVLIFVAIWVGLYMARELTVPVERLVQGAREVGAGNLDVSVSASGHDEISTLIESFNNMTRDLKENRERLTQASADLEQRRLQLEAVLANVGTGVIAVDGSKTITTFNRAVSRLLRTPVERTVGRRYDEALGQEAAPLVDVIDRALSIATPADSSLPAAAQWSFKSGEETRVLAAVATPLRDGGVTWGAVVVIDDMTHITKGQREMAWREVARRIAHEIKNPLTPIKLSAQRLQRRFSDSRGRDAELLQECTETIIRHTDELKEMVNEFSNFARFPEISPEENDLNLALSEVAALFQPAHPGVVFKMNLESKLPPFEFDRDQVKRVVINLFDNAIAALEGSQARSRWVALATHYNEKLRMAVIEVTDNGPGMTEDVRNRVFEPYFSTKSEGTGLGLAIAKRIINDHDGFIRVTSAPGEGTRFVIELPTGRRHALAAGDAPVARGTAPDRLRNPEGTQNL